MKISIERLVCIIGGIIFLISAVIFREKGPSIVWANIIAAGLLFINGIVPSKKGKAKK